MQLPESQTVYCFVCFLFTKRYMRKITLLLMNLVLISLSGCELGVLQARKSFESKEVNGYQQSYEKWLTDKASHNESYQYVVTFSSWAGFGENTTITVNRGVVTDRSYQAWKYNNDKPGDREITTQWRENASNLDSHQEGAASQTLDQLYQQCSSDWLRVNISQNTIYFESKNNGLLSLYGYVPKNCQDDCFTGVRISDFHWLE
jgi:hypothetical protein